MTDMNLHQTGELEVYSAPEEPPAERNAPLRPSIDVGDEGGDPPCWAHLLDDEGNLPQIRH